MDTGKVKKVTAKINHINFTNVVLSPKENGCAGKFSEIGERIFKEGSRKAVHITSINLSFRDDMKHNSLPDITNFSALNQRSRMSNNNAPNAKTSRNVFKQDLS